MATLDGILEAAKAGTLRPTRLRGLRFSLKAENPAILCCEVVDDRLTFLARYCLPVSQLVSRYDMVRLTKRFEAIDDV